MRNVDPSNCRLDVFVLSCNRARFIGDTLRSLIAQTFQDFRLVVLDNASTDATCDVVDSLRSNREIMFVRNASNLGVAENIKKAVGLTDAPWVMLFHDDDILHCRYLELAFAVIDEHRTCNLVGANFQDRKHAEIDAFNREYSLTTQSDIRLFRDQAHFASFCYTDNRIGFASAIYRSDSLRSVTLRWERFGKLCDRPLMIEAVGSGSAAVFLDPLMIYRVHDKQDSQDSASGPFLCQAIELTRFYRSVMGDALNTRTGLSFKISNRAFLKYMYKWCSDRQQMCFSRFVYTALRAGAATWYSFVPRPLSRLVKKAFRKVDPLFV